MSVDTSWPDLVWNTDALRALDPRARRELEAAGALLSFAAFEKVFARGSAADHLFVVIEGEIEIRVAGPGDGGVVVIRRVTTGSTFGEDAVVRIAAVRGVDAVAVRAATLARIPGPILVRTLTRAGASLDADVRFRTFRRASLTLAMQGMAFVRDLPVRDLGVLIDAAKPLTFAREKPIFKEGDPAREVYFVADGGVQIAEPNNKQNAVARYVSQRDFFGDEEALAREARRSTAVAAGSTWLLSVPLDAFESVVVRNRELFETAQRERRATLNVHEPESSQRLGDVYRLDVARSLLVIDQEQCVRCGHCASSCANTHDDGIARLVRSGPKISVTIAGSSKNLGLPRSCQHCSTPACLEPCPTGAIGRKENGDVFIRESLCTGCGACVKACPWDNIQLTQLTAGNFVAVKCDLCDTRDEGPACVAACPVEAISRIEPREVVGELRPKGHTITPPKRPTAALFVAACLGSIALSIVFRNRSAYVSGYVLAAAFGGLAAYAVVKRRFSLPLKIAIKRLSPFYVSHWFLGMLASGAGLAHMRWHLETNSLGFLFLFTLGALLSGFFGWLAYAVIPAALSRLENELSLPEDFAGLTQKAEESLLRELSGQRAGIKELFARVLDPYRRSRIGPFLLVLSRRTCAEESSYLLARIAAILQRKETSVDGLVAAVVTLRALHARRWLQRLLAAWLPIHVVCVVVASGLAVKHVLFELVRR